jgi:arylsulfatase A-like enzyme
MYWEHGNAQAFRSGDWKLLRLKTKDGIDTSLFNLKEDPNEQQNLANEMKEIVQQLEQEAMESRFSSNDFKSFLD